MLNSKFLSRLCFKILFYNLILNFEYSYTQNLILNYSFEDITSCPSEVNQLYLTTTWTNPSTGTIDLYNSCYLNDFYVGVPSNGLGYQNSQEGEGYVGGYLYSIQDTSITTNIREYLQTQLISNLVNCSIYEVSFYISLADSSHYAINSIGAFLSDSAIHRDDYNCFSYYEPQVSNPKSKMLTEKNGWTKIDGKFVANGGEQYITIGNFDLDDEINTLATNGNFSSTYAFAYYYLDEVSLTLFNDASMPANAGPDIDLTEGDSVFIGQEISNLNCTWSVLGGAEITDSISGIYVQPIENTTYVVEQSLCGVTTYDTVTVFIHGVGVSSLEGGQRWVTIYPNPSNGSFEIDLTKINAPIQDLSILDASGRIVYQEKNVTSSNKLNIQTHLKKGVYFLRINSEKGAFDEKLVIQ